MTEILSDRLSQCVTCYKLLLSKQPVAENEEIELAVGELNSDVNGDSDEPKFHPLLEIDAKIPLDSIEITSNFPGKTSLIQSE
ncbi:hypothetical protein AVEN_252000-1 [Araneus ventricosus]|uniref:Uncharacterized protein n=1 Tax=Araneus ventricosus TaxID=182803 RepID=A0A4Y2SJY8_ARAVE|nr:hypothetical protein AVEN_252000-1 [Araneus ventricosus]